MKIVNRKYNRDYTLIEKLEVGIVLTGAEVKSVRAGAIRLDEAFVRVLGDELYLVNADIPVYQYSRPQGYDSRRSRKLLIHKREMLRLRGKMSASGGLTLAPVSCYNKGSLIKLEIALSKGRREREKEKLVKERDIASDEKREAKEYLKS